MTHRTSTAFLALGAGLALAGAPAARADTLETPAVGGANFTSAAGWQAWSAPSTDGTHRLRLRRPDGTVLTPEIPRFGAPADPAIGTRGGADGINTPASRRLSAVYSRCAGSSTLAGCDVYALDLTTLVEERVHALASKTYSETVPSLTFGNWSFVRRGGGTRKGTYSYLERGRSRGLVRLSPTLARATASSLGRMAFTYNSGRGFGVQIRQSSGEGGTLVAAARLEREPVSPQITRYRAGWLLPGDGVTRVFTTRRFAGSGGPFELVVDEAPRTLPATARSAAGDSATLFSRYLDSRGVQRIDPAIR
ncbi:MAG: hypothetical protein M3417_03385 [Actinomycetota bacterium]|nr:hypothetical protein [Actinomycetota bacterium]